jgi:hypothetical protein
VISMLDHFFHFNEMKSFKPSKTLHKARSKRRCSNTGSRTRVPCVTGRYPNRWTMSD